MPDAWELVYWPGGGSGGATNDWDGDGASNLAEWRAGTDPTLATSVFRVSGIGPSPSGIVVRWLSVSSRLYRISDATGLSTAFSPLASNLPATPPENVHTDGLSGAKSRFYRIGLERQGD